MQKELNSLNKDALAAAMNHMGKIGWLTIAITVFVWMMLGLCITLFAQGFLPTWLATLLVGMLTYMSYTPLHEAVHGNIHGNRAQLRWINDLCGYLVAPIIGVPYASHKHEHFTHHRYTNIPDKDPDFLISGMGKGFFSVFITTIKFFYAQNLFFAKNNWQTAQKKDKVIYCLEILVSLSWRLVVIAVINQPGIAIVMLLGYFIGGFFTAYWFAYRPHIPYQNTQRYLTTNSLIMPFWMRPFEWFWLGQNLHSIHHLFPRVPFYRYHALHREIEPILRAHGTPIVGIWSRKPIEAKH